MSKDKHYDRTAPGRKKPGNGSGPGTKDNSVPEYPDETLENSEERLRFALEGSGDGVWDWIVQTGEAYLSPRSKEILGFSNGEIQDRSDEWESRVHPDDIEFVNREIETCLAGKVPMYRTEHRLRCKDGTYKWILARGKVISWAEDGKPLRMVGTHKDISARKQAEEEIKESRRRYAAIFDQSPIAIEFFDAEGKLEMSNRASLEMLGQTGSKMVKKWGLFGNPYLKDHEKSSLREGGSVNTEYDFVFESDEGSPLARIASKTPKRLSASITPLMEKGSIIGYVAQTQDVTARRIAELKIVSERLKLLRVFDNITGMIVVTDPDTHKILYANKPVLDAFGKDSVGDFCYRRFHETEAPCPDCRGITTPVEAKETVSSELYSPVTGRRYRETNRLIRWIDGREVFLKFAVDVTDQAMMEEALRQSQVNFSTFFNTVQDFLFVLDMDGNIVIVNDTVVERLGYARSELTGYPVLMLHPPERREEAAAIIRDMLRGELSHCPIPLVTKDGRQIPVETKVSRGKWNGQDALFGISEDVSELCISEEKFAKTFQASAALMALTRWEDGRFVDVNQAVLTTLGYAREEVIGKTTLELNIFVDIGEREATRREVVERGKARHMEVRIRTKQGDIRHGLFSADLLHVQDTPYLLTTMLDITQVKRAEEEVRMEKSFSDSTIDSLPGIFYLFDEKGMMLRWNRNVETVTGYQAEELAGMHVLQFFGGKDVRMMERTFREVLEKGEGSVEARLFSKNGRSIPHFFTGKRVELGEQVYVLGLAVDISEIKRLEEELRKHKDRLEEEVAKRTADLEKNREELEMRTKTLEEVNTALKVLVRQIGEDKKEMEARFISNVKAMVLPYVEQVKKGRLDSRQQSGISIIETNLNEIVSTFVQSVGQFGFTPREMQIASLIKDGKTSKEIGEFIGIAPSAVDTYRNKIRHKLNLNNKKVNLQSYLQSIK